MAYDLYPAVDENYVFPPEVLLALAGTAELRNTVVPMTTTTRNNLTAPELWDGRTIANTTTHRLERYDVVSTAWAQVADLSDVQSSKDYAANLVAGYWTWVRRDTDVTIQPADNYNVDWETVGTDVHHLPFEWTTAGVVIPVTGIYGVRFLIDFTGVAAGRTGVAITVNGTTVDSGDRMYNAAAKALVMSTGLPTIAFNKYDVISGRIYAYEQASTVSVMRLAIAGPIARTNPLTP